MKKAFDQNVSRAKPRVRLGALLTTPPTAPTSDAPEQAPATPPAQAQASTTPLAGVVKERIEKTKAPRPPAAQAVLEALGAPVVPPPRTPVAKTEAPETIIEVQNPSPPQVQVDDVETRRERLKERLKAVRENPKPEPLPATVAEAGVLAVGRIDALKGELKELKALNLALTQELEAARRTAERATEEARARMDEARRLSAEMDERARLLSELEGELSTLEGERDEALLALQESRRAHEVNEQERAKLQEEIAKKEQALAESLLEEERLAGELEAAREESLGLKRALELMQAERDTLARQVADLTRERAELLEARRALEAVHLALSNAVAK